VALNLEVDSVLWPKIGNQIMMPWLIAENTSKVNYLREFEVLLKKAIFCNMDFKSRAVERGA
jgi:hypothetical protein